MKRHAFTPLESPAIYGGDEIYQSLIPIRKDGVKALSFLTGFTLIETLLVVIILSILAAIVLPIYVKTIEKTKAEEAKNNLRLIQVEEKRFFTRNGYFSYDKIKGDGSGINALAMDNPNKGPNRNFDYSVHEYSTNPPNFEAKAKRRPDAGFPYRNHEYTIHKDGIVEGPI